MRKIVVVLLIAGMLPLAIFSRVQAFQTSPIQSSQWNNETLGSQWAPYSATQPTSSCQSVWAAASAAWISTPINCYSNGTGSAVAIYYKFPVPVYVYSVTIYADELLRNALFPGVAGDHFLQVWNPETGNWLNSAVSPYNVETDTVSVNHNLEGLWIRKIQTGYATMITDVRTTYSGEQASPTPITDLPTNIPLSTINAPSGTPNSTYTNVPPTATRVLPTLVATMFPTFVGFPTECDPFNPCGTMPFPVLMLPTFDLPSPTLVIVPPTKTAVQITTTPSQVPTSTPTPDVSPTFSGPSLTPTPGYAPTAFSFDGGPVNELSTTIAQGISTVAPITDAQYSVDGSNQSVDDMAARLGGQIAMPIQLARGLELTDLNKIGGLFGFLLFLFAFYVGGNILFATLPFLIFFVELVLKIVNIIASMIP